MSRGRVSFTVAAARRAKKAAGDDRTVGISPDGTIYLLPNHLIPPLTGLRPDGQKPEPNPWDET